MNREAGAIATRVGVLIERPWLLFLGAGLSVPCGLKNWKGLAEAAIELGRNNGVLPETLPYAKAQLEHSRFGTVFDAIERELPPGAWLNWLRQQITPTSRPGALHQLIFKLRPTGVITTNYDTIAEAAFSEALGRGPAIFDNDDKSLLGLQAASDFLCHFHGRPDGGTLVLGQTSYQLFYHRTTAPRDCLRQLLLRYNVLFLGFGHGDLDFEFLYQGALEQLNPNTHGLSLLPSDRTSNELVERLRRLNIQVIAYDKIDPGHSGLRNVLELVRSPVGQIERAALRLTEAGQPVSVRAAIIGILTLKSEAHKEMQQLLPAAALISALLESAGNSTIAKLHQSLLQQYSLPSSFELQDVEKIANRLELEKLLHVRDDTVSLDPSVKERYLQEVEQRQKDIRDLVSRAVGLAIEEGAITRRTQLGSAVEMFLCELFRKHGMDVADSVLGNRPAVHDLAASMERAIAGTQIADSRSRAAVQRAVLRLLRDPSNEDAKAIYWLCQTYFLLGAYTLDPEATKFSELAVSGVRLWLDSNVILPVIADYHPLQNIYRRLLQGSAAEGSQLLVLTKLIDEVYGNVTRSWEIVNDLEADPAAIDIYVESLGWERANVFLVGFSRARAAGRLKSWNEYVELTGLPRRGSGFRASIRGLIERKVHADVVSPSLETHGTAVLVLANELEDLRKAKWQFRHRVLCTNEAHQVLQVYRDRNATGRLEGIPSAWFITTDGFVNQLYERHAAEWILPCAQHPSRWYQLVEALVPSSTAHRGFSQLFMNVALTAYREEQVRKILITMHSEYKELMTKRPHEVQGLLLRVLRDFAVQADEEWEPAVSKSELTEREEEAIRLTLARFRDEAGRLFGEYEMLRTEVQKAKARIKEMEKELERKGRTADKKSYRQRQLESQVRQQQQRIVELQRALRQTQEIKLR